MEDTDREFSVNDGFNLLKVNVSDAVQDGSLQYIVSTFDPMDQVIYDGFYEGGRKIISFANILQHDLFPFPESLQKYCVSVRKKWEGL